MADYKWKPIEDLPEDWTKLASSELGGLAAVWREHYETIKDSKALKQFNERLRREWAIETGIIENLYFINESTTQTLIENGIEADLIQHGSTDKPAELIVPILKDHEIVVEGLFEFVGQRRQLTTSYINELHQALMQHQPTTSAMNSFGQPVEAPLLRGKWKKLPNNPTKKDNSIHEYCPPEQVASEMDRLISLHQEHLEKGVPPEVEAAWLHHRFTQIHPFQDGNGRMARTLASLIFLRAGLFPLVIRRDERNEYINVLEIADRGELASLVQLFSRSQKKAINQAVSLSENILLDGAPLEKIIEAGISRLEAKLYKFTDNPAPSNEASLGSHLLHLAKNKLNEVATDLKRQLTKITPYFETASFGFVDFDDEENGDEEQYRGFTALEFLYADVKALAKESGYTPKFPFHPAWLFLQISASDDFEIVLSFHEVGKIKEDIFAITAFIPSQAMLNSNWEIDKTSYKKLSKEVFQFTNKESKENVIMRFNSWLDEVILNGINYWQRQL